MRDEKTKQSFINYLHDDKNQGLRFWQALRNWSGFAFIFGSDLTPPGLTNEDDDAHRKLFIQQLTDTFYREGYKEL